MAIASAPRWKLSSDIHSLGACAFSPGSPKPISTTGAPSVSSNAFTMGMEPPSRMVTGSRP